MEGIFAPFAPSWLISQKITPQEEHNPNDSKISPRFVFDFGDHVDRGDF
jgi:hypothetical protein